MDVDPFPEPAFHFDVDLDTNPTPSFTHVGKCWKTRNFFYIYSHLFVVIGIIIYNIIMNIIFG